MANVGHALTRALRKIVSAVRRGNGQLGEGETEVRGGVTRVGTLCVVCKAVVKVELGRDRTPPYVCSLCVQRPIKKLCRERDARARRVQHGGSF